MTDRNLQHSFSGGQVVLETADGPVSYDSKLLIAATLIFIAKGSGRIEPQESGVMLELLREYCGATGAEGLDLLTQAITELAERPTLQAALATFARSLPDPGKEDLAYMALRVIAADGRREAAEMAQFRAAVEAAGIHPEIVHRAFDRFFAETMPDPPE
ncbi:MAG TPA: TerB family tellurite resistance protein [Woeseiaceae bacterium]|nr:TerB family tellurite resistance protein [Woeseiaceae bacterium]